MRKRASLCAELSDIEVDLAEQLIKSYRGGAGYEEFWELVNRLSSFSQMRREFCGRPRES